MEINNRDTFELRQKTKSPQAADDFAKNFFLSDEGSFVKNPVETTKRLNDYDYNLLKDGAYKDISNDVFKLEYKISKTEEEMRELRSQIQASAEIKDYETVGTLNGRLQILQEDYEALTAMYNDKSLSAKFSGCISDIISDNLKAKFQDFKKKLTNMPEAVMSKMPKRIASIIEIKKSLHKLENINKNVDELISLNIPYGEHIDKYNQLSKYIIKANEIQSAIAKYIKK